VRENKYEIILKEAAKLIGQKGYAGTSFQEIADRVGIHKSTLFHYFKNKEQMLLLILESSIETVYTNLEYIIGNTQLRPEQKLEQAISNHLTMLVEYFDNINVYLNEFRNLSSGNRAVYLTKRKKYENDFKKIVLEMMEAGYYEDLNPKVVTFGILGMLNWTAKWFREDGKFSISEVARDFYRMVTQKGVPAGTQVSESSGVFMGDRQEER
jgi:TetR/AcrR family transcriptional regulator, cholesterol catabolism regulator